MKKYKYIYLLVINFALIITSCIYLQEDQRVTTPRTELKEITKEEYDNFLRLKVVKDEPQRIDDNSQVKQYLDAITEIDNQVIKPNIPDQIEIADLKQPGFGVQEIIGQDSRLPVSDTKKFPYNCIGYLLLEYNINGVLKHYGGTGFLAEDHIVLTAGHNLCIEENGDLYLAEKAIFIPGLAGNLSEADAYLADVILPNPEYEEKVISDENNSKYYDYGFLLFAQNLGEIYGHMGSSALEEDIVVGKGISIAGYPGDKGYSMYSMGGIIKGFDSTLLRHEIDTYRGNSGSPIYMNNTPRQYYAVGIHTSGSSVCNYGTTMTSKIVSQTSALEEYVEEKCDS